MEHVDSRLRYIAAEHVDTPVGPLSGMALVGPSDQRVGTLEGMVIDPIKRRARYFVVRSRNWLTTHHHLVPASPARLDPQRKMLHVDIEGDDLARLGEVPANAFQRYSDDDLIAALFSPHAA